MKIIWKSSIGTSIFLMILGLLLIFRSEITIISISYIIGAVLLAAGVFALIRFIKNAKNVTNTMSLDILYGLVTIIFGILIILHPQAIASSLPIILGISIIINSAGKLQYAFVLKNDQNEMWKTTMAIALISTICGVLLLFNPFAGAVAIMRIVGIFILAYAVLDIISTLIIKKNVDEFKSVIDSVEVQEAEIVDESHKTESKSKKTKKSSRKTNKKKD